MFILILLPVSSYKIDYVEFERHAAGGSNMHYFDLLIRLKTEQEHLFRNIQRNEYHNLFDFIRFGLFLT
jgi:structure-specific recognition protein 1